MLDGTNVAGSLVSGNSWEETLIADVSKLGVGPSCDSDRMPGRADPNARAMASVITSIETDSQVLNTTNHAWS